MKKDSDSVDLFMERLVTAQPDIRCFIAGALSYYPDDIYDVLQETNLALIRHKLDWQPGGPFLPFAIAFAKNQIRAFRKRRNADRLVFDDTLLDAYAETAFAPAADESQPPLIKRLLICLQKLAPGKRDLVLLRYQRGKTARAIAADQRRKEGAVRAELFKIRKSLFDCISRLCRLNAADDLPDDLSGMDDLISRSVEGRPPDDGSFKSLLAALAADRAALGAYSEQVIVHSLLTDFYQAREPVVAARLPRALPRWLKVAAALALLTGLTAWAVVRFLNRASVPAPAPAASQTIPAPTLAATVQVPVPVAIASPATNPFPKAIVASGVTETRETNMNIRTALKITSAAALAAATVTAPRAAQATDFTWTGNGADARWATAGNWQGNAAPGVGDGVIIPDSVSVLANDDDAPILSTVGSFRLGNGAALSISNETVFSVTGTVSGTHGTLVKLGSGTLLAPGTSRYDGTTIISNGLFQTFNVMGNAWEDPRMGKVCVYAPGILGVATNGNTGINSLWGDGVVTNIGVNQGRQLHISGSGCDFAGRISGPIRWWSGGNINLLGTNNNFNGNVSFGMNGNARVGVQCLGMQNKMPSSIGTTSGIEFRDGNSTLCYLGNGETTDRMVSINPNENQSYDIDAGPNGGITFNGPWTIGKQGNAYFTRVYLTGTNAEPAVLNCSYYERSDGTNGSTYITKQGSGTWTFKDKASRKNCGVIDVREGTLRFESIAETNQVCSLGLATMLASPDATGPVLTDSLRLPYAYSLGGVGTVGTMEYIGTNDCVCTTRPFALAGNGRLLNNGTGTLALSGFSALDSASTLTLGGSNAGTNIASDLTDGFSTLSLAKEDSGTWVLGGTNNTFGGTLAVNGGTLAVKTESYRWFCFVVKQGNTNDSSTDSNIQLNEFALYDAEGNRINIGLVKNTSYNQPQALQAGEFTYAANYNCFTNRDGDNLFDDTTAGGGAGWCSPGTGTKAALANPDTWQYVYFRLSDDAEDVASYDICSWNNSSREPTAWELRASRDGVNWVTLDDRDRAVPPSWIRWYSNNSGFASGQVRTGYPVTLPAVETNLLPNVSGVSVAAGAKLASIGLPVPLRTLTVDIAAGGGTIENCEFAASGKLYVTHVSGRSVNLPITFAGCANLGNLAKWKLYVNGEPSEAYSIIVTGNTARLSACGTIFRLGS